jgi:hypothetical protein
MLITIVLIFIVLATCRCSGKHDSVARNCCSSWCGLFCGIFWKGIFVFVLSCKELVSLLDTIQSAANFIDHVPSWE